MTPEQRRALAVDLTPRFPRGRGYVPHVPHAPQQAFLWLKDVAEVFYGGAAGGGKSDAGLMAVLQYADVPGYSALILRRTFADLALPGAIMDRAATWLAHTDARKKDGGKRWEFPTNDPSRPATLQFGYAQTHADITRYQGAEFQAIFIDELTHFEERTYLYAFSRLRGPAAPCQGCGHMTSQPAGKPRGHDEGHDLCVCGHEHPPGSECLDCGCDSYDPSGCDCTTPIVDRDALDELGRPLFVPTDDGLILPDVPLRMRSGSNPGGVGHEWVRSRFVANVEAGKRVFVPAKLADNPSLDRRAYRQSLGHLSSVEQARLEDGDWDVSDDGDVFERSWFRIVDASQVPYRDCTWVRYWDNAAAVPKVKGGKTVDPDWTVGTLVGLDKVGRWWIVDVQRFRKSPYEAEQAQLATARLDTRAIAVRMEQEPGSSGVKVIDDYRRRVFVGYDFDGVRPVLSKLERARPMARAAENGLVSIVSAPWNRVWLDELGGFPTLPHDDCVDSASGAFGVLADGVGSKIIA